MIRLIALFLLISFAAQAAPCTVTPFYDGFSGQFFNTSTVTGFIYGLDETYLYVTLTNGKVSGFIHVPLSTAQSFAHTKNADTFYSQQVLHRYRQPLMTEACQNILTEDGNYLLAL